jgi:hypothetical protein
MRAGTTEHASAEAGANGASLTENWVFFNVLAFDVGVVNLALCVMRVGYNIYKPLTRETLSKASRDFLRSFTYRVLDWRDVRILAENVSGNADIDDVVDSIMPGLLELIPTLKRHPVDLIAIEQQPMGAGPTAFGASTRNVKMKVVSHILQALLREHGFTQPIRFVSPEKKMKDTAVAVALADYSCRTVSKKGTKEDAYDTRKLLARVVVSNILHDSRDTALSVLIESSKKDDLCDAFLYCLYCGMDMVYDSFFAHTEKAPLVVAPSKPSWK